jgi:hypothetical protein
LILRSELELLSRLKPVIFMEYDPYFQARIGEDGLAALEALRGIGYRAAIVFESWGDYLLCADLGNRSLLEDLHSYYSGRKSLRYCDICLFHEQDHDLARQVRLNELQFAAQTRR